jgi:hypothetical protein
MLSEAKHPCICKPKKNTGILRRLRLLKMTGGYGVPRNPIFSHLLSPWAIFCRPYGPYRTAVRTTREREPGIGKVLFLISDF